MILSSPPPLVAALFFAAALLASALLIPAGPAHAFGGSTQQSTDNRPLAQRCADNFGNSSAASTCVNVTFTKVLNDQCRINYTCTKDDGSSRTGWKTVDPNAAGSLQNCDGELKASC